MKKWVKGILINYFKNRGLPGLDAEEDLLKYKYLEKGIIDSLGIVELITAFENEFNIVFSPQDMQSAKFSTIGGLIAIIERLLEKKNEESRTDKIAVKNT